jgi:hypothetical protein
VLEILDALRVLEGAESEVSRASFYEKVYLRAGWALRQKRPKTCEFLLRDIISYDPCLRRYRGFAIGDLCTCLGIWYAVIFGGNLEDIIALFRTEPLTMSERQQVRDEITAMEQWRKTEGWEYTVDRLRTARDPARVRTALDDAITVSECCISVSTGASSSIIQRS